MTTSPVLSITDELLDDLQQKAKAATPGTWEHIRHRELSMVASDEWELLDIRCDQPNDNSDGEFIAAANPATILAMVEHIRSLTERLKAEEKDAKALNFMLAEECRVRGYLTQNGVRYGLIWDDLGESQVGLFTTQREAIDAAIAQEGQSHE